MRPSKNRLIPPEWNGDRIRAERMRRNMTQVELADQMGCRQQTISEWECGMYEPQNAYQKLLTIIFDKLEVPHVEATEEKME